MVKHQFQDLLGNQTRLADWIQFYASVSSISRVLESAKSYDLTQAGSDQKAILRSVFPKIILSRGNVSFQVDRKTLVELLGSETKPMQDPDMGADPDCGLVRFAIDLPITIKRRGGETRAIIANHV